MNTTKDTGPTFGLTVVECNGKPMAFDLELAKLLGFKSLLDIRKPIRRAIDGGFLNDSEFFASVAINDDPRGRGRPGVQYHLTQTGALLIMTRCRTKKAQEFTRGIVRGFEDHLLKKLASNDNGTGVSAAEFAEMQRTLLKLQCELALLSAGHITAAQHQRMKADVARLAALEHATGRFATPGAASSDIYREFREVTCWGGRAQPWRLAPAGLIHAVGVILRGRDASIQREIKLLAANRQMRLPEVPLESEVPPKKETTH